MRDINEWLEKHVNGYLGEPHFSHSKAEFRDAAQALIAQAEANGFTIQQIKVACGGDVETFLMDRQNAKVDAEMSQRGEKER